MLHLVHAALRSVSPEPTALLHSLLVTYTIPDSLQNSFAAQKNRVKNGELYRYIADTRGAFVQPALYEAFGEQHPALNNSNCPDILWSGICVAGSGLLGLLLARRRIIDRACSSPQA